MFLYSVNSFAMGKFSCDICVYVHVIKIMLKTSTLQNHENPDMHWPIPYK